MIKTLKTLIHHLTPKQFLTRAAGFFAEREWGEVTTFVIETFISIYHIDMKEALKENPEDYKTFNEFFIRELKPGLRPLPRGLNAIAAPVDGTIAEYGYITYGRLIAAKGQDYSLRTLLGGDEQVSAPFEDGNFETIYLAPSNYHRIHMPMAGTLRKIIYIPGKYYSVNPDYVERIEGLFAKNERAVAIFDTAAGPMALVFVGATIVGSIGITGIGIISPNKERKIKVTEFPAETAPTYAKGEEIGYFKLGSTVITIFGKKSVTLSPEQKSGSAVKMGTLMGYVAGNAAGTKSPDSETEEDKPAAEDTVKEESPASEEPSQGEAPVSEETVHEEPPASEESVQEEAPAAEEAVQEEAPASEEPAQEEAPASEESVQDDILIYDEPVQNEAPVSEEPAEDSASGETAQPQKKASAASGRKDTAKRSRKSKSGKRK
ncbi:MAG: archaetidylserine decarboxylase [Succinimonas sp.]|nr:archaetidylserine decarboxylase [Succinimonas sp.]